MDPRAPRQERGGLCTFGEPPASRGLGAVEEPPVEEPIADGLDDDQIEGAAVGEDVVVRGVDGIVAGDVDVDAVSRSDLTRERAVASDGLQPRDGAARARGRDGRDARAEADDEDARRSSRLEGCPQVWDAGDVEQMNRFTMGAAGPL